MDGCSSGKSRALIFLIRIRNAIRCHEDSTLGSVAQIHIILAGTSTSLTSREQWWQGKRGVVDEFSREESRINGRASVGTQGRSSATTTVQVLVILHRVLSFEARVSQSRAFRRGRCGANGCVVAFLPCPGCFDTMTRAKRWQLACSIYQIAFLVV